MKKILTLIILLSNSITKADYWIQKADFGGVKRASAFAFSINTKGYVGCGENTITSTLLKDFWEYNQASNVWTQKADFGGTARWHAIGFSVLNKGYAGCGYDSVSIYNDLWEYNPSTNTWLQKNNFPGLVSSWRMNTFSIDSFGYVTQTAPATLWRYDPINNLWIQKTFFSAGGRQGAVSFSIGNKGYFGTGFFNFQDFWQYDVVTDLWTQVANVPSPMRGDAAGFSIGNMGYIGIGEENNGVIYLNDFWQYDPALNQWNQKASFIGTPRDETIYFSIGNKGYIGLGGHDDIPQFLCQDFFEYTPDSTTDIPIITEPSFTIIISPNPVIDKLNIEVNTNEHLEFILYDIASKKIIQKQFTTSTTINTEQLAKGIYNYEVRNKSGLCKKGKVVKD